MAERPKTLLLTGASRGIGHATVKRFAREGWRVITCSRQPFPEKCPWGGGRDDHIEVDLADPNRTMEAIEVIRSRIGGRLDALVNNAGISPKGAGGSRLSSIDTDLRDWGKVFHVNFFAPIVLARGLKDELSAAKGAVVNVTSIAGSRVHPFAGAAYATSKAALKALTREMAHDFGPLGVRVNAIAPGFILTDLTRKLWSDAAMQAWGIANTPERRLGTPDDLAGTAIFLASRAAAFVTGQVLYVDGGFTAGWSWPIPAAATT